MLELCKHMVKDSPCPSELNNLLGFPAAMPLCSSPLLLCRMKALPPPDYFSRPLVSAWNEPSRLPSALQFSQSSPGRFPRKSRHGHLSWLPGKRLNNTRSSYLFGILVLTLWNKYARHSSLEWKGIAAMILHCSQQNLSKTSQRPLMDHLRCCNPDAVSVLSTSCTRSSRAQKE